MSIDDRKLSILNKEIEDLKDKLDSLSKKLAFNIEDTKKNTEDIDNLK